jgi:hypothetical protein
VAAEWALRPTSEKRAVMGGRSRFLAIILLIGGEKPWVGAGSGFCWFRGFPTAYRWRPDRAARTTLDPDGHLGPGGVWGLGTVFVLPNAARCDASLWERGCSILSTPPLPAAGVRAAESAWDDRVVIEFCF